MNGSDAVTIAQQALRWAAADASRKELLAEVRQARAEGRPTAALEKLQRHNAARAAGLRRGLARKCMDVLLKGVSEPGVVR